MWVQIKQKSNDNVESDDLSTHVLLSKEREAAQNNRITDLEIKQRESEERERELKNLLLRTISGAAVALISSIISIATVVFSYFKGN